MSNAPIIILSLLLAHTALAGSKDTLAFNAKVGEERSEFTEFEILAATYADYKLPEGFYDNRLAKDESIYYINTVSIHSSEKGRGWVELCTEDWKEAKRWQVATDSSSSQHRKLISERETDKYFEFKTEDYAHPSWVHYMRVHKCSYIDRSGCDLLNRPRSRDFSGWFQGTLNLRPITELTARELGEYLWIYDNYSVEGSKALSSFARDIGNDICHTMYVLRKVTQDDDALFVDDNRRTEPVQHRERAEVTLVRLDYRVDTTSGRITLDSHDIRTIKVKSNPPELIAE
jgi:hypothetical protein